MARKNTQISTDDKIVELINSGVSIPKAAAKMNMHPSTMADAYYRLEPVADPSLLITGTPAKVAKQIVTLRNAGMRWERLAIRSGKKIADVQAIYTEHTKVEAKTHYCGRGRHYETRFTQPVKTRRTRKTSKAA